MFIKDVYLIYLKYKDALLKDSYINIIKGRNTKIYSYKKKNTLKHPYYKILVKYKSYLMYNFYKNLSHGNRRESL